MICNDCPRQCGIDRERGELGYCAQPDTMQVARIALHPYEEPIISGNSGSGTIFFCGCSLRCVFCQNKEISRGSFKGASYTPAALAEEMLKLQDKGATNINLVTPTHFSSSVVKALEIARCALKIPIVYNTSGYERVEVLRRLHGLIDIYLPDFKYMSPELGKRYSHAENYAQVVQAALPEMYRQVGGLSYAPDGTLARGMIVRHLVLPGSRTDSIAVLKRLAELLPVDNILLSLMSQYTPEFASDCEYKSLHRRLTKFEYSSVVTVAQELGFNGFIQAHSSASSKYTPDF